MRSLRSIGRTRGIQILVVAVVGLALALVVSDALGLRSPEPLTLTATAPTTRAATSTAPTLPPTVPTVVIPARPVEGEADTTTSTASASVEPDPSIMVGPALIDVPIFLLDESGAVVERSRTVVEGVAAVAALNALLVGPTEQERTEGVTTAVPSGAALVDARLDDDGLFTVDVSASFAERVLSSEAPAAVAQVVCTVDGYTGVEAVRLLVNGDVRDEVRGVPVAEPLTCETALALLAGD